MYYTILRIAINDFIKKIYQKEVYYRSDISNKKNQDPGTTVTATFVHASIVQTQVLLQLCPQIP